MEYEAGRVPDLEQLVRLYESVGWTAYTENPESLLTAVRNSTFVITAWIDAELAGLARVLSDDVSILYVQDVLVDPHHQRAGVGRELLERCLAEFSHVRQRVLLTDDEPHQHRLYRAVGFHDVAEVSNVRLHAFADVLGANLVSAPLSSKG